MKLFLSLCILAVSLWSSDLSIALDALKKSDYKVALESFERLAEEGNMLAQQNLAVMYNNGIGVEKDIEKANYWFNYFTEDEIIYN